MAFAGVINRAEARRNGARLADGTAAKRHHGDQGRGTAANGAVTINGTAAAPVADAGGGSAPIIPAVEDGACCQQPSPAAGAAPASTADLLHPSDQYEQRAPEPAQPLDRHQEALCQRQSPAGLQHQQQQHEPQEQAQAQPGDSDAWARYRFPDAELAARGIVLDIASPQSAVVNCFTKSYGTYSKACFSSDHHTCCIADVRRTLHRPIQQWSTARLAVVAAKAGCASCQTASCRTPQITLRLYHLNQAVKSLQGSGSVLATENLQLLPKLAAAFPQYHAAAAGPGAELPAARARPDLQPGEPAGEYLQVAAATEAAAALGLKVGMQLPSLQKVVAHRQWTLVVRSTPIERYATLRPACWSALRSACLPPGGGGREAPTGDAGGSVGWPTMRQSAYLI